MKSYDWLRCSAVLKLPTAKVSNVDLARSIERQLYGAPQSIRLLSLGEFNDRYQAGISRN